MLSALVLVTALAAPPKPIDELLTSLPPDVMAKAWGIDAEFREMALKAAETKVDRKNGYLEFIKDVEGIVYTVQAAMFLGEDGSPLVAVSFDRGDAALGLTSIVFYRAQGSGWVEVHPLPHLFESDFKIPKGNIGCPTCMLVYSFKLPRQGTVVEARAQYRSFPSPEEAGPGDTYEVHDEYAVALKWDKKNGVFVKK